MFKRLCISFSVVLLFLTSCSNNKNQDSIIKIGVRSDVETFNPMFAFQSLEGNIAELMFLPLISYNWNKTSGELEPVNVLAKEIKWSEDSSSVTILIRDDVYWSDSTLCTVDDIIYSFDLYSDPDLQSRFVGFFNNYFTDENGKVLAEKSFEKLSDYQLKINFKNKSSVSFFDFDQLILPKHSFQDVKKEEIATCQFNFSPLTNGPYKLESWQKSQTITLVKNPDCFLVDEASPNKIIFKITPDYNSLLLQLKKGELDLVEEIKPEDAEELKSESHLEIATVKGRQYDYIGWNTVDPANPGNPHPVFGNKEMRKAITYALNRKEVLNNYLYNYGELALGPISSIFVNSFDSQLPQYEYNPEKAKEIIAGLGYSDVDNDGILEKDGKDFTFSISIPSGNPLREFAANIFSNNLKSIGIDVKMEFMEMNNFVDGLFGHQFDSWMVGWMTPIPLNLKIQWYSDVSSTPFNFGSYNNPKVDSLLLVTEKKISIDKKSDAFRQINRLIYEDQPFSFLYWIDNIIAYNSRVKNLDVNPLGVIHKCWDWRIE